MSWVRPVGLTGERVALEPLREDHAEALEAAVEDGELWRLWYTNVPSPAEMGAEIGRRLAQQAAGAWLPFAVVDPASGLAIGMTSYLNIVPTVHRLEIGSTWYRRSVQRTGVNVECKLLLLRHAFEALDCIAVELRTHRFNQASRRAIETLGAQLDGVLRNHFSPSGETRDTCVYSITAPEWPQVERHLRWRLTREIDRGGAGDRRG